jgi:hypothetical protein
MTEGRRSALIVANDTYDDPRLRRLRAPAADAEELARVLRDPAIGGFDVQVSTNEPEHIMRRRLATFFDDRGPDDLLLLHLSCHGVKDEDGRLYFATPDTEVDQLDATAVPADYVNRQMTRSRCRRVVLLLDCCYSGAFARGMVSRAGDRVDIKDRFEGRGRVVLTASSAMEYSFEGDQLAGQGQPSVFTSALVRGLATGEADRDRDGVISVDELYDFAYEQVRSVTPSQTPGKWVFDVQGEIFIARSVLPATPTPDDLPPELPAAGEAPADRPPAAATGSTVVPASASVAVAARVAAGTMPAAIPLPLLAQDLDRWNVFAALSPLVALTAAWLLLITSRAVSRAAISAAAAGAVLLTTGVVTGVGALGLVKFSAQRIDGVAVALSVLLVLGSSVAVVSGGRSLRGTVADAPTPVEQGELILLVVGGALCGAALFLPYDGSSSLWSELGDGGGSAEFLLVPVVGLAGIVVGVTTLSSRRSFAGALVCCVGVLLSAHFVGVLIAAALAIGEAGEVQPAGFLGLVGAITVLAVGRRIARLQSAAGGVPGLTGTT